MKTKTAVLNGKPDAGNPHVRFDEGEVASAKPRRGSLLYKAQLIASVAAFGTASLFAANWSYTESGDIQLPEIAESTTITISSGVTVRNTTALTGTGLLTVKGGGTLCLTQASPSFEGGLYLDGGDVSVTTGGALGTGLVTLHGNTGSNPSKVIFDIGGQTVEFTNDFYIDNSSGGSTKPHMQFDGNTSSTVTLSGAITSTRLFSMMGCSTGITKTPKVVFTGALDVQDSKNVYCVNTAIFDFQGKVTVPGSLYAYANVSPTRTPEVRLSSAQNCIGKLEARKSGKIHLDGENASGGAAVINTDGSSSVYFNGKSQVLAYIRKTNGTLEGSSSGDTGTAILTLTGGVASVAMSTEAKGAMGFVIDDKGANGDFMQIQSNGTHTITGPITVKRGTFAIRGNATYKKVSSIAVDGGTLEIATSESSPFAALTSLSVGATGKLKIASGVAMPFPNNQTVDVSFMTGAAYDGDDIEVFAKSLTIDGQVMEKGVWTHEDNEAIPEGITISMVSKKIEITESGEIDFAATYGAVDGYWQVTVASGVTVTNTTALTGAAGNIIAIAGGGTFVQEVASPGFASEIRIGKATVTVVSDRGLGTGRIVIDGKTKAGGTSRLAFANGDEPIEMPNEIDIRSNGGSSDNSQLYFFDGTGLVTFSGDVSADGFDVYIWGTISTDWKTVGADFTGRVIVGLVQTGGRTIRFHGALDAERVCAFANASNPKTISAVELYSPDNRIGYCYAARGGCIRVKEAESLGGAQIGMTTSWTGEFSVYSNDQTAAYITGDCKGYINGAATGDPATLTLTGGVVSATMGLATLSDRMNIVVDDRGEAGDFVQVLTDATHTMKGTITVKRGTLELGDSVSFKNLTGVGVSADGALVLGDNEVFGTAADVKKNDLTLRLDPDSSVTVADGVTVNVHRLWIGEEGKVAGDYTGAGGPSTATVLPQLSGTGILHVGHSSGQGLLLLFR